MLLALHRGGVLPAVGSPLDLASGGAMDLYARGLEVIMPAISMFYGIVIYLYFFDDERHKLPHVHARYQEHRAAISILDGSILGGDLPQAKIRLVQA
jgi:hypothetical protein